MTTDSNQYKYHLIGEKHYRETHETMMLYRKRAGKAILEMPAREICASQNMLSKFPPLDIRTISFIAGAEYFLETRSI